MTTAEQFTNWVQQEKEAAMLSFLQTADAKERKELAPLIKKLNRYYRELISGKNNSYSSRGTREQLDMLLLAGFICLPQKEFEKDFYSSWIIDPRQFNKIRNWYCPSWFGDLVNKQAEDDYMAYWVSYDWIMQLADEGILQPSQKLITKALPNYIFKSVTKDNKQAWEIVYENLVKRPVTLEQHIWYFFEEESTIHYAGRYLHFSEKQDAADSGWIPVLCHYSAEGKIDRQRLLKESLLAGNKNFNKVLSGWFADLFLALAPTPEELLSLQPELFSALSSPHSKLVNECLQLLKKIVKEKSFDTAALTYAMPPALSSKSKTSVVSALMLLEQAAKYHPEVSATAASLCCHALLHADDALQTRAAKIICKYAVAGDDALTAALLPYAGGLLQNARQLLGDLVRQEKAAAVHEQPAASAEPITEEKLPEPVSPVDTVDELLFLTAQAFDNNDALHFHLLPAALVTMQHQLKGEVLSQLQPALQRALKLTKSGLHSVQGYYDHMLSLFFIDVCVHLVRKYPEEAKELNDVFEHFSRQDGDTVHKWMHVGPGESYLASWENYYKDPFYQPYKQWLTEALLKIREGDALPLLSTPTHQPGWIAPEILVERIILYQQKGALAEPMDTQLALSRCHLKNTAAAVALAKEKLTGEWKSLLLFLLQDQAEPEGIPKQREAWMMASLSKHPKKMYAAFHSFGYYEKPFEKYSGQCKWSCEEEEYERVEYKWENNRTQTYKVKDTHKLLKVFFPPATNKQDGGSRVKEWLQKLKGKSKPPPPPQLLYDYFEIKAPYISIEYNDIRRALLMVPNNPEAFLPQLVSRCLKNSSDTGEAEKRMLIAVLQLLMEIWEEPGEMAHLFVATSLLSADKTAAGTAAALWLRYSVVHKADSALIGRIIGIQERIEFGPLKRLNDLIMQSLFRVSAAHNRQLQIMIEHILAELPATPVRHLKKLLEIYGEVLAANGRATPPDAVMKQLHSWKEHTALKKTAERLIS